MVVGCPGGANTDVVEHVELNGVTTVGVDPVVLDLVAPSVEPDTSLPAPADPLTDAVRDETVDGSSGANPTDVVSSTTTTSMLLFASTWAPTWTLTTTPPPLPLTLSPSTPTLPSVSTTSSYMPLD